MKRRMFSTLLGSAPIAAAVGAQGQVVATGEKVPMIAGIVQSRYGASISNVPIFNKARDAYFASKNYRNRVRSISLYKTNSNANVDALRSVSHQHKIHMIVMEEMQEMEKDRSFFAKLADSLGLTKWFSETSGNGDSSGGLL